MTNSELSRATARCGWRPAGGRDAVDGRARQLLAAAGTGDVTGHTCVCARARARVDVLQLHGTRTAVMAAEMYYQSAGGLPVRSSTAQVRDLLAEGTLTKRTRVWVPGQRDWATLGEVASQLLATSLPHLAGHSTELTVSPQSRGHRSSCAIWAVTDEISAHGHNIRERPTTDSAVQGVVFTGERLKVRPRVRQSGWMQVQWGRTDAWVLVEDGIRRYLLPT
eukprot:COSAG03_NODE_101_length_12843_cov_4.151679_6_plen_221_part_01